MNLPTKKALRNSSRWLENIFWKSGLRIFRTPETRLSPFAVKPRVRL